MAARVFRSIGPLIALLASVAGACVSAAPGPSISDAEVAAYAAKPFDKAAMMFHRVNLGVNHGAPVVAEFPCSDICPQYTTRIIHYDLDPGPACAAAGGVDVVRMVPVSIAVMQKHFCVPKVLAGKP